MKKSHLIITALLIVFVIAIVGGLSKIGRDSPPPVSSSSSSKNSAAAAAPNGPSSGMTMTYRCTVDGKPATLHSLKEVWENPDGGCLAKQGEGTPNTTQATALAEAYGYNADHDDNLVHLFQLCAYTRTDQSSGIFVDEDAKKEMLAAYMLCPMHPNKAVFDKVIAEGSAAAAENIAKAEAEVERVKAEAEAKKAQAAAEAEAKKAQATAEAEKARADMEAQQKAFADGLRVGEGNYLVGTEVQPGTWQTIATKVTECYWEISDAQGNIIDNNFISVAPQFTITVPATASGFTVSGCSFQRIGD